VTFEIVLYYRIGCKTNDLVIIFSLLLSRYFSQPIHQNRLASRLPGGYLKRIKTYAHPCFPMKELFELRTATERGPTVRGYAIGFNN